MYYIACNREKKRIISGAQIQSPKVTVDCIVDLVPIA